MNIQNSIYRERFKKTLAHKPVDRPPMDLASTDMTQIFGGPRRLVRFLGIEDKNGIPKDVDEAVLKALDIDFRGVGGVLLRPEFPAGLVSGDIVNVWGIRCRYNGDKYGYERIGTPLKGATIEDIKRYPWPDPEQISEEQIEKYRFQAKHLYEETPYVVCGRHPVYGIMELGCWLFGYDDFLYRMAAEPKVVHCFFDVILKFQKRVIERYYSAIGPYLHFTTSGDDFGTQAGPFFSLSMFRELIVPYFEERIRYTRQFTDAKFFHHSCGAIYPLIPDLIRIGVEILNPIQPRADGMEPGRLKREFGDSLIFYGAVDTQELLRTSSPLLTQSSVRELIKTLGKNGGYILSASHVLQNDIPDENIIAMYNACAESAKK
jgi:uroporphyrinogen decarboxylase